MDFRLRGNEQTIFCCVQRHFSYIFLTPVSRVYSNGFDKMKWIYLKGFFCIAVFCFSDIAAAGDLIYGIENAVKTNSHQGGSIQAASFSRQSYAIHYQREIQAFTSYKVSVVHRANHYKVIIGPMPTALERQQAAHAILNKLHPIAKQSRPLKSMPVTKHPRENDQPQTKVTMVNNVTNKLTNANWFLTIGGGGQFPQSKSNITVSNGSNFPSPFDVDTYSSHQHATNGLLLLSAGRRWALERPWIPAYSLGLYYQYLFPSKTSGTITQYSEPQFKNYNYQFNTTSNVLLASAKMNVYKINRLSPYISGGIGGAFNRLSNYQEIALPGVTPRISPAFASNTSNQFAYNAGAGLDLQLLPSLLVSVGYLYQHIGDATSGPGKRTWSNTSLNLGSLAQNEVVASVSYLVDP